MVKISLSKGKRNSFLLLESFVLQMSDISQHIDLTSSQIERLRSKFARYESPPSFYYEQQEEYTNKLQDFNVRKQMLQEQIHQVWPLAQFFLFQF